MRRQLLHLERLVLILVFGCAIYLPLAVGIFQADRVASSNEKRNLAQLPSWPSSLAALQDYPQTFNQYYADQFGFREELTGAWFQLVQNLGLAPPIEDVTRGRDGWLFLGSLAPGYKGYDNPFGDVMNLDLFTEEELATYARVLTGIRDWLRARGVEYLFAIAPNKHTIYFDKLPAAVVRRNPESAADQLVAYLGEHTDLRVVDLRPTLLAAKREGEVYSKHDTHWNARGANVAQYRIMQDVAVAFPGQVQPRLLSAEELPLHLGERGDLGLMLHLNDNRELLPEPVFSHECEPRVEGHIESIRETHTRICDGRTLNAVIFGDSFLNALIPFLSRQFHRATFIHDGINAASLAQWVERGKPAIVIEEVVERSFPRVPASFP